MGERIKKTRTVSAYPDAKEMKEKYAKLYKDLKKEKEALDKEIHAQTQHYSSCPAMESADLEGSYYTLFVEKKNKFMDDIEKAKAEFAAFSLRLEDAMTEADDMKKLWDGRIGEKKTEVYYVEG